MPVIAIQGVRGGTGVTTVTAGLAWALQELGEAVLVIDLSPDNLLRLHFNMPFAQQRGWARSVLDHNPWQDSAMRYTSLLDFLPFGSISNSELNVLENQIKNSPVFSVSVLSEIQKMNDYKWVLLDLPYGHRLFTQMGSNLAAHWIVLLNADANCHIRLHQQELPDNSHILLNQFNPISLLQRDLKVLWQATIPNLLPLLIHKDESFAESLATKQPVGEYAPDNLSSKEILALANWCLVHFTGDAS